MVSVSPDHEMRSSDLTQVCVAGLERRHFTRRDTASKKPRELFPDDDGSVQHTRKFQLRERVMRTRSCFLVGEAAVKEEQEDAVREFHVGGGHGRIVPHPLWTC